MEFFHLIKATQKSGKEDAVIWQSQKTETRANLALDVALEDAEIETGRGHDYLKPVRTDFPVFDDLPEEGVVDFEWCKHYELGDDGRTWYPIVKTNVTESHVDVDNNSDNSNSIQGESVQQELQKLTVVATLPLRQRLLAQFISDKEYSYHIDAEQKKKLQLLEMDVDNSYVQNLLLAAENVEPFKKAHELDIWKVINALTTIFPIEGKRTELSVVIHFFKTWFRTEYIDRGILVREWAAGNRISNVQRTESGANADSGYVTDRGQGAHHTLDTLDLEIACAILPMDFNHFEIPQSVLSRAKEIVKKKEEPWKSWSSILRNQPGVLAVNRTAIFNLVRTAPENIHRTPVAHLEFVNKTMTAEFNAVVGLLPLTGSVVIPETPKEQPHVGNHGNGVFSIEGLTTSNAVSHQPNAAAEFAENVQMEKTGSDETPNDSALSTSPEKIVASTSAYENDSSTATVDNNSGHHIDNPVEMPYTHLMIDIEALGKKPDSPVVSIGAVFFDPMTGNTGSEFYKIISLESSMACGGVPDASTIIFWLKASPEARSEIVMDDAIPLDDALLQFNEFIAENATNGNDSVQVWGNGASYDNVLLEASYDRSEIPCPWKYWNNRDVRTIVELGKTVGYTPRYEIPFVGEPHKAISDAHHQVKYVSAIWQRLTKH